MNKLRLGEMIEVEGLGAIQQLEGGFGENTRCLTVWQVAIIHGMPTGDVNKLIKNNRDEFEDGIDIMDLKNKDDYKESLIELGLTKQQIANYSNIYILSEQGYMALITLMKTDKAREIRKIVRREYFSMREVINSSEQLKAMALLKVVEGTTIEDRMSGVNIYANLRVQEETKPLLQTIMTQEPKVRMYDKYIDSNGLINTDSLAKISGVGKIKMLRKFRELGILRSDSYVNAKGKTVYCENHNTPYQKYAKYFEVKLVVNNGGFGGNKIFIKPEGVDYLLKKLNGGI